LAPLVQAAGRVVSRALNSSTGPAV